MRGLLLIPLIGLFLAGGASAKGTTLFGTVGPGFSIRLSDAAGNPVKHLDPGTYTFQIDDRAEVHNFHLTGPGVDKATDTDQVEMVTWTVNLVEGKYHYQCDPHAGTMFGNFTVGNVVTTPPPPPPTKVTALAAAVGPGAKITVSRRSVAAGPVVLTVNDRSAKDNFHLTGPGVNRMTSKLGKGRFAWKLTLKAGTYVYRSDATPKLRGTFKAV